MPGAPEGLGGRRGDFAAEARKPGPDRVPAG